MKNLPQYFEDSRKHRAEMLEQLEDTFGISKAFATGTGRSVDVDKLSNPRIKNFVHALKDRKRVGGKGSSHKGSRWVKANASVSFKLGSKKKKGVVINASHNHAVVAVEGVGSVPVVPEELTKLKKPVKLDWDKHHSTEPKIGTLVVKRDTDAQRKHPYIYGGKVGDKAVLLGVPRPGHTAQVTRERTEHHNIETYLPETYTIAKNKKTRVRPDEVVSTSQKVRRATNLQYVKHLPEKERKVILAHESDLMDKLDSTIQKRTKYMAHKLGVTDPDLIGEMTSHARVAAMTQIRAYHRSPKKFIDRVVDRKAKVATTKAGHSLKTKEGQAYHANAMKKYSRATNHESHLRDKILLEASTAAKKRGYEMMDETGLTGISRRDLALVSNATSALRSDLQRKPTANEIANKLGWVDEEGIGRVVNIQRRLKMKRTDLSALERAEEGENKSDILPEEQVELAKPDRDMSAKDAERRTQVIALAQKAGLGRTQMELVMLGMKHDLLGASPSQRADLAKIVAKELSAKTGSRENASRVLREWDAAVAHLMKHAQLTKSFGSTYARVKMALEKSQVKAHTKTLKNGRVVQVKGYTDKRTKKEPEVKKDSRVKKEQEPEVSFGTKDDLLKKLAIYYDKKRLNAHVKNSYHDWISSDMEIPMDELKQKLNEFDPPHGTFYDMTTDVYAFRKLGGTLKELKHRIKTYEHYLDRQKFIEKMYKDNG